MNEFDEAVAGSLQSTRAQEARFGFAAASQTNPDDYAEARRIAERTGVPAEVVLGKQRAQLQREDAVASIDFDTLAQVAPATAMLLSDMQRARLAHDSVDNLSATETLLRSFKSGLTGGLRGADAGAIEESAQILSVIDRVESGELSDDVRLANATPYASMFAGAGRSPENLARLRAFHQNRLAQNAGEFTRRGKELDHLTPGPAVRKFQQAQGWGDSFSAFLESPVDVSTNIVAQSLGTLTPSLPFIVSGGLAGGARGLAATTGATSANIEYGAAIAEAMQEAGVDLNDAAAVQAMVASPEFAEIRRKAQIKAAFVGAFDAAGAALMGARLRPSAAGNVAAQAGAQMGFGAAGEAAGSAASGQAINPSSVIAEAIGEVPGALIDVATIASRNLVTTAQKAEQAEQGAAALEQINQLAAASKVLQRAPDVFEEFVAQAAADGPVPRVYIDAQTLQQSGLAEQVAALSPAVAAQYPDALQTGGQIAIPVEEYATRIAPTELAPALADHLRTEAEGFSRAEARAFMESEAPKLLQAEFERAAVEQQDDQAFKASTEAVRAQVQAQLVATQRFGAKVNESYATLVAQHYAVTAAKLGITPEALYARYPRLVQAEAGEGRQFGQKGSDDYDGPMMAEIEALNPVETVEIMQEALDAVGEARFEAYARERIRRQSSNGKFHYYEDMMVEASARAIVALARRSREALEKHLASTLPPSVYNQSDDKTLNLFGDVPEGDRAAQPGAGESAGRRAGLRLSRDDAPAGRYATRTELVRENTRTLGARRVNTPQEAAQALAYLGAGAVERLDALITDKNGKPLAIVGAFKGALTQASVYPATLTAEAFRVKGAANIWFAHNHPSGTDQFSAADRLLHRTLTEVFRGSEIKPRGLFAIAGKMGPGRQWVYEAPPPSLSHESDPALDMRGETAAPAATSKVAVAERVYVQEDKLGPPISSLAQAKEAALALSGGDPGVLLLNSANYPVAFVPVEPAQVGELRRGGRMDALYRALSMANPHAAIIVNRAMTKAEATNLAGLFNSQDVRVYDVLEIQGSTVTASWAEKGWDTGNRGFRQSDFVLRKERPRARGMFNPQSGIITLLKDADLSTFLHEAGHAFLDMQFDIAAKLASQETRAASEQQLVDDAQAVLKWFGVPDLPTWFALDFEEMRHYHEQFARGFEAYLFEGKAPSIELQSLFQRFRAWLLAVYRSLKALNVDLTDEVRGVFDRMLASTEQIKLAEQARSMLPFFETAEQAGMTAEEFAAYQNLDPDASNEAIEALQARGLRDMRWLHNARGRVVKRLQKEAQAERRVVRMAVRREVMAEPVYQAWRFLTRRLKPDDKIAYPQAPKSDRNDVDPAIDSLFAAIAKLGGLQREEVIATWGTDPADKPSARVFGKPVWRRDGGLSIDAMVEALAQHGYLNTDEHGKADVSELEDKFAAELSGDTQYALGYDPSLNFDGRPGEQVVNPAAVDAGRLDRIALNDLRLPEESMARLEALNMVASEGWHPDLLAERFGFSSGDELVRELLAVQPPEEAIETFTDQRMLAEHGELATPEAIERAADQAIHNDLRARMVATEANALAKATGAPRVLAAAAKEYAAAVVARRKVREITPGQYASAATRAAKAADTARRAGDIALAAAHKRNELIQRYAARAAYDGQDEVAAGVRYLNKFNGDVALDAAYAEQIHALLARYDLRRRSDKANERTASLRTWVQGQLNAGHLPEIAESLLSPDERAAYQAQIQTRDASGELVYADDEERIKLLADAIERSARRPYRELTLEEFRGLVDTVRQIEHLGRLKHKILTARAQAQYAAVRDEIAAGIAQHARAGNRDTRTANDWLGQKWQAIKQFAASHIKVATWARQMDGGIDDGPVWRYLIQPANERAAQETTMRAEATAKLDAIMRPILAGVRIADKTGKGTFFASLGESLNWQERFAIALNLGNESNLQRLLGGRGWTMAQIKPVLDTLSAREWQAVQAVWDVFESYRPAIGAKEMRVTGKEPDWIPARALTVQSADGQTLTLRGGYYPVRYDPRTHLKSAQHAAAEDARNAMKAAYSAATTRRSFTKARVEELHGRPLLLSLQGLYSGINDVIHDLAWHEWVIDANRLLGSRTIDAAIRRHYGPEVKREFERWRDDIVAGTRRLDHAVEHAAGFFRRNIATASLTFNVMSAALQPLGLANSIARVGAPWIGRGVARYVAQPVEATREAQAKSAWLANRTRTRFRELNELANQVQGQTRFGELRARYGFWLMTRAQMLVDVPTWWGAYEKAIASGADERTAVNLGDQAVKDAQGGGEEVDQSGIERGGPLVKLFTVFYGFMATTLNTAYLSATTQRSRAKMAAELLLVLSVPALLGSALKDALTPGGDEDDEDLPAKLAGEQLSFLFGLVAFGREFSQLARVLTGEGHGQGYSGPAGLRMVPDTYRLAEQATQGEIDDAFRKAFVNVLGDLSGLPSAQVNRSITGAQALIEGETENPAAVVFGFATN